MLEETGVGGTAISCLTFGHTRLNRTLFIIGKHNTGKCEHRTVEKMRPYSMCYSTASYETIQLINGLSKIKVRLDPIELLQKPQNSGSEDGKCDEQIN